MQADRRYVNTGTKEASRPAQKTGKGAAEKEKMVMMFIEILLALIILWCLVCVGIFLTEWTEVDEEEGIIDVR